MGGAAGPAGPTGRCWRHLSKCLGGAVPEPGPWGGQGLVWGRADPTLHQGVRDRLPWKGREPVAGWARGEDVQRGPSQTPATVVSRAGTPVGEAQQEVT